MAEQRPAWYEIAAATETRPPVSPLDRLRDRPAAVVALAVVASLAVALAGVWVASSAASPYVDLDPVAAESGAGASPDEGTLVVDVGGAVRSPGVYHLAAGSRVGDAIAAAGGFGPAVDAAAAAAELNLAAPVADGQKIVVPVRGSGAAPSSGGSAAPALVDVNHASESELDALPGIGPVTAKKIIAARAERPFASTHELLDRKLVGQATWEKIRDLVTAG